VASGGVRIGGKGVDAAAALMTSRTLRVLGPGDPVLVGARSALAAALFRGEEGGVRMAELIDGFWELKEEGEEGGRAEGMRGGHRALMELEGGEE